MNGLEITQKQDKNVILTDCYYNKAANQRFDSCELAIKVSDLYMYTKNNTDPIHGDSLDVASRKFGEEYLKISKFDYLLSYGCMYISLDKYCTNHYFYK